MVTATQFVVPVRDLLRGLETDRRFATNIEALRQLPAQPARYGPWPARLHPAVRAAAEQLGVDQLYTHQAAAAKHALDERHVAVVSATASGKSLCYLLPVVDALARDPGARALLMFPTKALAHDQLAALEAWDDALPEADLAPAAYDGDTPQSARSAVRRAARVVVTNPDMLHTGILPHHTKWAALFEGLTHVVLDEMHVYRGVFGSHVANVLRRLRRVARFYRAAPTFVLTSATIANPGALGAALVGAPVTVVADDGAPRGQRTFVFYNPPVVDRRLNLRRSALLETEQLARHFLTGGVQTIVFARTRQSTELIRRYIAEGLADDASEVRGADIDGGIERDHDDDIDTGIDRDPTALVRSYRGGYRPRERRAIEAALRDGRLRGVVATNALELGIDIGQLDACVMAGYPGTIASTWQQAGRAGRRVDASAAVLVASAAPLDQFMVRHPDYFFGRSPEHARLDPDNLLVLLDHVRCAAFELPFDAQEAERPFGKPDTPPDATAPQQSDHPDDVAPHAIPADDTAPDDPEHGDPDDVVVGDGLPGDIEAGEIASGDIAAGAELPEGSGGVAPPTVGELLAVLEHEGVVTRVADRWYWMADAYPAEAVGLRSAGPDAVTVMLRDETAATADGQIRADVLGTVERSQAATTVHPGAVYLHDGRAFRVETLDWEAGQAFVRPSHSTLYTRASATVDVRPERTDRTRTAPGVEVAHGELEVRSRATSYREIRFRTHETIGHGEIDLPEHRHTGGGYWFTLTDVTVERLRALGRWQHDASGARGPSWARQRDRARARDGYRCRMCRAPERPDRQHDVHHIRPYRLFDTAGGDDASHEANQLENLITLCRSCHRRAERVLGLHGGLSGLGYALRQIAPLFLMCDRRDLDVSTSSHAPWAKRPAVVVYERAVAGVGFGAMLFKLHERLLDAVADLVRDCPCDLGCPSCVGPLGTVSVDAKAQTLAVLDALR